jgi:CubicO group peptidase (beta-lactamase class C family)
MPRRLRIGFAVLACCVAAAMTSVEARARDARLTAEERAHIDSAATTDFANGVGASLTIVRDGSVVYGRGFGTIAAGGDRFVDERTIFPIGSITKQFTAAAIELLALDGKLRIDAPLAAYLPDVPHARDVSLRRLLQQTSGYANITSQPGFAPFQTSRTVTPTQLIATIAHEPLDFTPGSQFEYSNTNYVLLGAVIEAVSHMPYEAFIHERIARPLKLATLSFEPPASNPNVVRSTWSSQATYAAGGLYAAPDDIVRWDEAFFGGTLLPQRIVAEMTTPAAIPGATLAYAFGWVVDTSDGRREIWHNGGVPGANTRNTWYPQHRTGVIVLTNDIAFDETAITHRVIAVVDPPDEATLRARRVPAAGEDPVVTARVRAEYDAWMNGTVDRAHYAPAFNAHVGPEVGAQASRMLRAAGPPTLVVYKGHDSAAGQSFDVYRVETNDAVFMVRIAFAPDGRIAGLRFIPA